MRWFERECSQNNCYEPWQRFAAWYFGRPQSKQFRITYNGGDVGFSRDAIAYYVVKEATQTQRAIPPTHRGMSDEQF